MDSGDDLEAMAAVLEASGEFRVLRRLRPRRHFADTAGTPLRMAVYVDVETTGLDPTQDEIIELAMVPFRYTPDGLIVQTLEPFQCFREPSIPISPEITRLTGIDASMVAGKSIDVLQVQGIVVPAAIVIAHNAGFDRRFLERLCDSFSIKPWACSQTQIPWAEEGFEGSRLSYLISQAGFFTDAHRALNDCLAAIELLARPLPKSGRIGMARLLEAARKTTYRIWAENSPFDLKDILKARSYRWNDGSDGRLRAWYLDVDQNFVAEELSFLKSEIYLGDVDLPITKITAADRFSDRV